MRLPSSRPLPSFKPAKAPAKGGSSAAGDNSRPPRLQQSHLVVVFQTTATADLPEVAASPSPLTPPTEMKTTVRLPKLSKVCLNMALALFPSTAA